MFYNFEKKFLPRNIWVNVMSSHVVSKNIKKNWVYKKNAKGWVGGKNKIKIDF